MRNSFKLIPALVLALCAAASHAAQLSSDARAAIPRDVRQLVVIDYRAMQNSDTAMQLRDRVMPPELKQFDEALRKSGLNDNHDVDQLAFALQGLQRRREEHAAGMHVDRLEIGRRVEDGVEVDR